jgi:hypothetical protein
MDDVRNDQKDSLQSVLLRRWRWFTRLLKLVFVCFVIYQAPRLTGVKVVRDWPLEKIFEGLAGEISSGSATWDWFGPVVYRDLLIKTSDGEPLLAVDRLEVNRSPLGLVFQPHDVGRIRLEGGRLSTAVWNGGSTIETVLEPWIQRISQNNQQTYVQSPGENRNYKTPSGHDSSYMTGTIEIVDTTIELTDLRHGDVWLLNEIAAVIPFPKYTESGEPSFFPSGTICSGALRHAKEPQLKMVESFSRVEKNVTRASIVNRANSMLARPGGWSVTVSEPETEGGKHSLVLGTTRCPAGISRIAANRFGWSHLLQGIIDVRADVLLDQALQMKWPALLTNKEALVNIKGNVVGRDLSIVEVATDRKELVIEKVDMPFEASLFPNKYVIHRFQAETNVGSFEAAGTIKATPVHRYKNDIVFPGWQALEVFQGDDFEAHASINVAPLLNAFPHIHVLRPDVQMTGGTVTVDIQSHEQESGRQICFRSELNNVSAIRGGKKIEWHAPWAAWVSARQQLKGQLYLEEAGLASTFADISMSGLSDAIETKWRIDLGRTFQSASELLDLQSESKKQSLSGISRGQCRVDRSSDVGSTKISTSLSIEDLNWVIGEQAVWKEHLVAIDLDANWIETQTDIALKTADFRFESGLDSFVVVLSKECKIARDFRKTLWSNMSNQVKNAPISFDCHMAGNLTTWQQRLLGFGATGGFELPSFQTQVAGEFESSWNIRYVGQQFQITKAMAQIEQLAIHAGSQRVEEPKVIISAVGSVDPDRGTIKLSSAEVLSSTVSLRTGGLQIVSRGSLGQPLIDTLFDTVQGQFQWQVDLTRLDKWLAQDTTLDAAGRLWGTADLLETPSGINLLMTITGSQLAVSHSNIRTGQRESLRGPVAWKESQVNGLLDATRPVVNETGANQLKINQFKIESSTVSVAATGSIKDLRGRQHVELGGMILMNWEQLTRLLSPSSRSMLKLTGGGPQPFAIRGSFGSSRTADDSVTVPLPDSWKAPSPQRSSPRQQLIALPTTQHARADRGVETWLPRITAETTLAWQGGQIADFPLGPGTLPLRLIEGQLAFGPFEIPVSGGKIRGTPWIQLLPSPGELILPPGRLIERIALTPPLCDRWLSWLSPILRSATDAEGFLTVDTSGGQLPLNDPLNGRFEGQLLLEQFSVTPGDMAGPLIKLLAKLQSVVDPRFAFGDQVVFLRARPDPVRVRIADGRIYHDNLVLDMGQLTVRSQGSMGHDGSLAMQLEVAFRGDLAGATPVVAQLLRTPFVIPLRGTVRSPQFDATALDTILKRIMQNTADAVLRDGIGRGLEALFGNPQPPEQNAPQPAQPLTFPDGS